MKGQNLRLFFGTGILGENEVGGVIAKAMTCTYHIQKDTEDSSNKDTTGNWKTSEVVAKGWDFSADALVVLEKDAGDAVGFVNILREMIEDDTPVPVQFAPTTGETNRVIIGRELCSGFALLTDLSVNPSNGQKVTYSVKGTGVGALIFSTSADPIHRV